MIRSIGVWGFMLFFTIALIGCVADEEDALQGDDKPDEEFDLEATDPGAASLAGVFDVGVIPAAGYGCPAGSDEIRIRMDDEDSGNRNQQFGWIGRTRSDGQTANTLLVFCKVNGDLFRPLSTGSTASDNADDYAVLKLGTTCPSGSQELWRYFDNEDSNNRNYTSGVIWPNTSNSYGTRLYFCLFRYASSGVSTMASFPSFGSLSYGVFAPGDFYRGISLGYIRTDDEDSSNGNGYGAPSDALYSAQRIVQPDGTVSHGATFLHFARVR